MKDAATIGSRLRAERLRLELSQEELGAHGGVKKLAQLNYEKGERMPDATYLAAVADLGVDVLYVVTGQRQVSMPVPLEAAKRAAMQAFTAAQALGGKVDAEQFERLFVSFCEARRSDVA